ncbi:M20/M25/M40 family metallo-hydrolase [Flavobacterium capsici]|uniref:Carboxypeptidase Q n=1 Tax=Flavobacterium capsici TaxID=3075618 RepID=A0AA96F2W2_9FLAO|nr:MULTISPECIES: M20/M25/M40 family metallo-hydrolase [unclassified Flavobacterium]WNM18543.1 M20/M25/M40 family metallo-hydrolase [Flavobacterium sp. PMR2A8]WNM22594.1 M20/M25/M40 family metallo-hydrolase [Flavobacterium sp. PMTSA4]
MNKLLLFCFLFPIFCFAQTKDEEMLKQIYNLSLTDSKAYPWLEYLSNSIGSRLSGSTGAEKAVLYTKSELEKLGLDNVYLQEVMVPKWVRGEKEKAYILDNKKKIEVPICALGGSVATPKNGISAEIIEVHTIEELQKLGSDKIRGKIVFFNRPMESNQIETFIAYRNCGDQRRIGAKEAAKFGAVGAIVRSLNLRLDDFPHTGATSYGDLPKNEYIPTAAISTNGAELLSKKIKENSNLKFYFKQSCFQMEDVLSYNVIGEIKGTVNPEQIMIVSGHLDSWDLADGSHDDGAGCTQSMAVLELFKKLNYKPNHTIRVVLFMNEENGGKGGKKYAELAEKNNENHIFALESDSGGFSPRGFSFECDESNYTKALGWKNLFEPYLIHNFVKGNGGSDINPLKSNKIIKVGLKPDSQRYFDYHHAANDTFDAVNKRELELGVAAIASLVYLFDQYGID